MPPTSSLSLYRTASVTTASKPRIVLLLLEGALLAVRKASSGLVLEDPAERNQTVHNNCERCRRIVAELRRALDLANGGKFAETMFGLYGFIERCLLDGNLRKEEEPLRRAEKFLADIHGAWDEMLRNTGGVATSPSQAQAGGAGRPGLNVCL